MKVVVQFSRTYEVELDVEPDYNEQVVRDKAVAMILDDDPEVNTGRLEFDGIC